MKSSANVHTTLYRKYRPEAFADVVGQDDIVSALSNSIKNNTLAHAYLFAGSRGTGKTSVARIFASEVGTHTDDLYEIDAASNRGINEIRELRSGVSTLPFHSRFKVYIIDEVHMLTEPAFNALLKTLEEPPPHVMFILATTEKQKILDTILSRCQVYDFHRPTIDELEGVIVGILKKEKRTLSKDVIRIVAKRGDGSFRNTLTELQKILTQFDDAPTVEELEKLFGTTNTDIIFDFLRGMEGKDTTALFDTFKTIKTQSLDIRMFVDQTTDVLRDMLFVKFDTASEAEISKQKGAEYIEQIKNLGGLTSKDLLFFLNLSTQLKTTNNPGMLFEASIIDVVQT